MRLPQAWNNQLKPVRAAVMAAEAVEGAQMRLSVEQDINSNGMGDGSW